MPKSATAGTMPQDEKRSISDRFLGFIENAGNKLPSPAMLFIYCLFISIGLSFVLSMVSFDMIDPRSGEAIQVRNLVDGHYLANFLASSVTTFTGFAPLGVVLVAIMGVGVAETSGFINTTLKKVLNMTPAKWITPMVVLVGAISWRLSIRQVWINDLSLLNL